MQAEVPPQMIEIDAVGAIAILQLKRSITPMSAASGQGPRSLASIIEASSTCAPDVLEDLQVPRLGHRALERDRARLEEGVEAHDSEADAALAVGAVLGARHLVRSAGDVVGEDVVEEAHHVLDEGLVLVPLVPGLEVERGLRQQTAVRSTPRWSLPVGSVISEQRFDVVTLRPRSR